MTMPSMHAGQNAVTFTSDGVTLHGHLFLPPNFDVTQSVPAVVLAPTWTSVKEQMADLYASCLAEQGLAVLDFDFRFYGESEGEPRQYESPEHKIEDIRNAVGYIQSLPFIDGNRVAGVGVCAGAGYMARAAAADDRIQSLVLLAPWLHNAELVQVIYGGAEGVQRRIDVGEAARRTYETTGEVEYVPACSRTDANAAMYGDLDYYLNPVRGGIPQWKNQFALMSWPGWLQFDPIAAAPQIGVPTLMVHSEDAAIPDGARMFFNGLQAPKEFVWTQGTQLDFYDQEPQVTTAVEAAAKHLHATL